MNPAKLAKLANIHRDIATDIWPNGAVLKCVVCSHTRTIMSQQAGSCLRSGWPSHCDRTMACDKAPAPVERFEITPKGRAAALDHEEAC